MTDKKTSEQWARHFEIEEDILDKDGWDRSDMKSFKRSWFEETITRYEFGRRLSKSTICFSDNMIRFIDNLN
jgi:hypothetical protein